MSNNAKKIYQKAMAEWGPDLQLIVLMEECGELIKECSKILRARRTGLAQIEYGPFIEELVDTQIMIEQMRYGWLDGLETDFIRFKLEKLEKVEAWLQSLATTARSE